MAIVSSQAAQVQYSEAEASGAFREKNETVQRGEVGIVANSGTKAGKGTHMWFLRWERARMQAKTTRAVRYELGCPSRILPGTTVVLREILDLGALQGVSVLSNLWVVLGVFIALHGSQNQSRKAGQSARLSALITPHCCTVQRFNHPPLSQRFLWFLPEPWRNMRRGGDAPSVGPGLQEKGCSTELL